MAVPRVSHDTSTCRSVGSTVRHDAMLTGATLSHTGNADSLRRVHVLASAEAAKTVPGGGLSLHLHGL